jgi:hypothetical protein
MGFGMCGEFGIVRFVFWCWSGELATIDWLPWTLTIRRLCFRVFTEDGMSFLGDCEFWYSDVEVGRVGW